VTATADQVERLLDALELLKQDQRQEAMQILQALIGDNADFEDAWLWMSAAVDSPDQAAVCLENTLRINPANARAAQALMRLRADELEVSQRRDQLRFIRDLSVTLMWGIVVVSLCTASATFAAIFNEIQQALP
jgi:hypothetical protein